MRKVITYGVLHYNPLMHQEARRVFKESVESLMKNKSKELNSEVYLIDQGNPIEECDITREMAESYDCQFISLTENVGISRGINLLAHIARGEYISLVTSDCLFSKDLDNILIRELIDDPTIFQICPLSSTSAIPYQVGDVNAEAPIKCLAQELTIQFWSRKAFETIGYFNETFKAGYENLDYSVRLFFSGAYSAISNKTKCHHYHNMTSKSGAFDMAYEGYIDVSSEKTQYKNDTKRRDLIRGMWNARWPNLNFESLYNLETVRNADNINLGRQLYENNLYMPYIQDVNY